jgi:hypothetical protein
MSNKAKLTAAHLRIVSDNGRTVPDPGQPTVSNVRRRLKLDRLDEPFARTRLRWLSQRWHPRLSVAELRLYFYLVCVSWEGQRIVLMTDDVANGAGLTEWQRRNLPRRLERHGLVAIEEAKRGSAPRIRVIV